ncbi:hypothetical protein L6V77_08655 [Myxococcota bacterium]|nr:hypothetical protein [Myxococcota bacterium]
MRLSPRRLRPTAQPGLALVGLLALAGCAEAISADPDLGPVDAQTRFGAVDLTSLVPGQTPRLDAGLEPPGPPTASPTKPPGGGPDAGGVPPTAAPTAPPTAGPTAPPNDRPDAGPAPPTAAPTAPPTQPPPREDECQTDEDCGASDMLCFGGFCVVDPAAPQQVGDGACTNPADDDVLRGDPSFRDISAACGLTCLGQMPAQPCVDGCVAQQTGFSSACAACYGAWMACVGSLCLIPCVFNDDQADCADCRDALCDVALETCGGYRAPVDW